MLNSRAMLNRDLRDSKIDTIRFLKVTPTGNAYVRDEIVSGQKRGSENLVETYLARSSFDTSGLLKFLQGTFNYTMIEFGEHTYGTRNQLDLNE